MIDMKPDASSIRERLTQFRYFVFYIMIIGFTCLGIWNHHLYRDLSHKIDNINHASKTDTSQDNNPHDHIISSIEKDHDMPFDRLSKLIIRDEGYRTAPYVDTVGSVTIGVGRSLTTNGVSTDELYAIRPDIDHKLLVRSATILGDRIKIKTLESARHIFDNPLTHHDVQLLLVHDLKNVQREALSVFGDKWDNISIARKEAILDILFNTGLPHFKKFEKFIEAVKLGDWHKASNELLNSQAARTNPKRYLRIARVIESGENELID